MGGTLVPCEPIFKRGVLSNVGLPVVIFMAVLDFAD